MIFLKKLRASGFKSFASNVEINFKHKVNGVIGPNGSGKSNIVDAIKWVLGEKSNKNLRGKSSDDVIFHGSKGHDPAKMAEVSITFDNSSKVLHTDLKEVTITRRLLRGSGENQYFVNDEPTRLKDIYDIFLDTGLSKGSLGIISQGTVQWFVEAKPEDRRMIFEEAAGIGLYSKKRDQALSQLQRANENLMRITDIVNELSSNLSKLQKQAEKAKIFSEKRKQLQYYDLSILVKDISFFSQKVSEINLEEQKINEQLNIFEPDIKESLENLSFAKQKLEIADRNIENLTIQLTDLIERINKIEIRKNAVLSKLENDLSSENLEKKLEAYKSLIATSKFEVDDNKNKINKLQLEISSYEEILNDLDVKRSQIFETSNKNSNLWAQHKVQIQNLKEAITNKNSLDFGVKAIIENQQALSGIYGLVKNFFKVDDKYEKAILTALGRSVQNIIVDSDTDASNAVDFLKTNRAGKATFIPLKSIKPKNVRQEHLEILNNLSGFEGIASEIIEFDEKFANVFAALLGNTIIANSLEDAINLSKYTYKIYRIISLDGDVINAGGAITGGFNKINQSYSVNLEKKLQEHEEAFANLEQELLDARVELNKIIASINEINAKLSEKKILWMRYQDAVKISENQLFKYQMEYDQLINKNDLNDQSNQWSENALDKELASLSSKKDRINEELSVARKSKSLYKSQVDDLEAKVEELRDQINKLKQDISVKKTDQVRSEAVIENAKNRINQNYHMTVEFAMENYSNELPISEDNARELISQLQAEINALGNVNMEAIEELESKQERYDQLSKQQEELTKAKQDIEKSIHELDQKASNDFKNTISSVNEILPSVFKYLFGGGSCQLSYTNPNDVLTSGIEVFANPPGKNIVNLNLLSGGEKTLVALSILFAILKIKAFPLVILDEAESALDPANVERFGEIIRNNELQTQFIVITHRPGTMERCDMLYGATMQTKGVTSIFKVTLAQAQKEFSNESEQD